MNYININTEQGLIRIKLLQNLFVEKYIVQLEKIYNVFQTEIRSGPPLGLFRGLDSKFVQEQTDKFITIVDELNSMGLNFPYQIHKDSLINQDDAAQDLLNKLHRSFTTSTKYHYAGNKILIWNERIESAFTIPDGKLARVLYLTEIVNEMVHDTEYYMKTHRKTSDRNKVLNQVELLANITNDNPYTDLGPYYTLKGWFTTYTEEDYSYFSDSNEYDVWVGRDILGKDFIHAYYDCDDPTNWDVTGSLGYSGKIAMDVGPTVKADILQSDNFHAWLDGYGVKYSKKMGGMPLGTIVEGKELLTLFGMPNHNIKVSFE